MCGWETHYPLKDIAASCSACYYPTDRGFLYSCIQPLVGAKVYVWLGDTLSIKGHSCKLLRMLLPYGQRFFVFMYTASSRGKGVCVAGRHTIH